MATPTLIHEVLNLNPGHYVVNEITVSDWSSEIIFDCTYSYPPEEKHFRLIFTDCRSVEWFIQHDGETARNTEKSQLITHDLGKGNHTETARMATAIAEVIISYGRLKIERDW